MGKAFDTRRSNREAWTKLNSPSGKSAINPMQDRRLRRDAAQKASFESLFLRCDEVGPRHRELVLGRPTAERLSYSNMRRNHKNRTSKVLSNKNGQLVHSDDGDPNVLPRCGFPSSEMPHRGLRDNQSDRL